MSDALLTVEAIAVDEVVKAGAIQTGVYPLLGRIVVLQVAFHLVDGTLAEGADVVRWYLRATKRVLRSLTR